MREQLINDLSKKISELKKLDIQNVAKWNCSAYFNVKVPGNMSLKTYREINNNGISVLKSVIL